MTGKRKPSGASRQAPASNDLGGEVSLRGEIRARAEQLNARLAAIEARLAHQEELAEMRLAAVERQQADHETRLRAASDSLVRLTTSTSLAQVFQASFALVLSALAAWLGRR